MFQVFAEHIVFLEGHLFVAHRAHIMIVAVVDIRFVGVLNAIFEGLPSGLWSELAGDVFGAGRFVEDAGLAAHVKVLAERVEPFEDGRVAGEGSEPNFIKWLFEA